MQIILVKSDKLHKYSFPNENINTYWVKDIDESGNDRDLIAIEKLDNKWFLFSNENCSIQENENISVQSEIHSNYFYSLKIKENAGTSNALLYFCQENDVSFASYVVNASGEYTIGNSADSNIYLDGQYIASSHAVLIKNDNEFRIKAVDTNYGVYVNNNRVNETIVESGDKIFILGYNFIILNNYIIVNNFNGKLKINSGNIVKQDLPKFTEELAETVSDDNAVLYNENDYFSRQPRFVTSIAEEDLKIDNPPGKIEQDETPLLYTVGPMITMTMTSAISVSTSVANLMSGRASAWSVIPSILIAVAMICSTILWPSLMRKYNRKKIAKKEEERQKKYSEYLEQKKQKILSIRTNQYQVLIENYAKPSELKNIILNKKRNLWERQIQSDDFLNVRIGVGTVPLKIKLNYGMEDFTMIEDNLKEDLNNLAESAKDIPDCPVTINLTERNKLVLIGEHNYQESMLKSILMQLVTYQAYNDLKLVFMISDNNSDLWDDVKILPHTWSDTKDIRFFANTYDEMSKISFYLEQVFTSRKYNDDDKLKEKKVTYKEVKPYYLIVVDNITKNKNIEIIDKILKEEGNIGFGLIILNEGISNLPNECTDFLTAAGDKSGIITNDLTKDNQQMFSMDSTDDINFGLMCEKLSNIPIKQDEIFNELKNSVGFLEMYKVGKVEHLNVLDRWQNNNPVNSLSVPIGLRADGEIFNLDLHEKFHGPHGLIAGMTGSGKSEFIITYILSMCLNFSPKEVSFVLIDYKGGGLTGAFENKLTGVKLPHLAGTITNLDTAEINRSLSSIQSELKRRQGLFNSVKAKLNESTLDIYKYQQLYREGLIDEPISHLFIISDEFAELKSQQSEFMDELISTARIGRSLGVHLILATQKPSGIVDDQIWSNSKFKVCLKVQEKSDSMDVIKRPDAVNLKKAGRFYLQVGYNDYFAIGQAAYAGTKYIPKDKISKIVNKDVSFIDNIGDTIKNVETVKRVETLAQGEELTNILNYICDKAKEKNLYAEKLWLDKIPGEIFVTNLMKKYSFIPKPWDITAIVGELDDPNNQRQDLLTIDFNDGGNVLVYGSSGKEIFISSVIYSLIIGHSSDEINIYIIDFGSEMFGTFVDAPQIGDVVFVNESEKLVNLFNNLVKELDKRKKLFANYSGSYNLYIKNSGSTLPQYIIFINNYEGLTENYENFVDLVASLSREGEKYGIKFVITATGVNAVRGKTAQNFNKQFCLSFNDPTDYMSILGSTHGMIPSDIEGRGLVKIDNEIYEFQTAYPYKWDEINSFIKNICSELSERVKNRVSKIAVLPDHVRINHVASKLSDLKHTPIGIEKDSLEISTFDFAKNPISLVSSQDSSILDKFVPSLGQVLEKISAVELIIVDALESIADSSGFKHYYNENFDEVFNLLSKASEQQGDITYVFMIYGVEAFIQAFDDDKQRTIKSLFVNIKNNKNVRVIFADSIGKIKLFEYEDFYRKCIEPIYAIWVGSGITDQFTIKSSTYNKITRSQIPNDFGYNVSRGTATQIKLLDFYSKD